MKRARLVAGAVIIVLAVAAAAWLHLHPPGAPPAGLSGYVEGDPLYLAAPASGSVTRLEVADGQRVEAGAFAFEVDPRTAAAETAASSAAVESAVRAVASADAQVAQARAAAGQARIDAGSARRDADRFAALAASGSGAVSAIDADHAEALSHGRAAALDAAVAATAGASARAAQARADLARARASLAEARVRLDQLSVRIPATGRIEKVYYQRGEWAGANQPVLSLIPDGRVKLRFFAPERDAALYRPGREVTFSCDSCGRPMTARIVWINPQPEYTPPVIFSREASDRLMFRVEAVPEANATALNPGEPAEVVPLGAASGG